MQKKNLTKTLAQAVARSLVSNLKTKANTASCGLWYEPKAPAELSRYQKDNR